MSDLEILTKENQATLDVLCEKWGKFFEKEEFNTDITNEELKSLIQKSNPTFNSIQFSNYVPSLLYNYGHSDSIYRYIISKLKLFSINPYYNHGYLASVFSNYTKSEYNYNTSGILINDINILTAGLIEFNYWTGGHYNISRFPKFVKTDDQSRLHCVDNYAIETYNGVKNYWFHGQNVNPHLFHKLQNRELTFDEFVKETNEETKSLIMAYYQEVYGTEFLYRFLSEHLEEKDTYVDKKDSKYLEGTVKSMNIGVYTLFTGKYQGDFSWSHIQIAFIRCYCPSTDRMFFLSVSPYYKNAKDAIASLCRIPSKLKNEIVSIARQGEMFSFNFTEQGLKIIKTMKKSDFAQTVAVSGDEYFSKMKFEY